jgi:serine/threonine protein phosphatase PrpC
MVADGMGGAAAGEIASEMAVEVVLQQMRRRWRDGSTVEPVAFVGTLKAAAEVANATIHHYAADHPELRGMGTTATIAGLLGDTLYIAQVGDSRAYLVRDGVAIQITKDQSLMQKLIEAGEITVEEAEMSDRRNIILQALGPEPHVKIDLTHQTVRRDDILVLCSDGLSGLVKPDQIARAVTEEASPELAAERLVELANSSGGPDNITVVDCAVRRVRARIRCSGRRSWAPVFDSPDLVTPTSTSPIVRVESIPSPQPSFPRWRRRRRTSSDRSADPVCPCPRGGRNRADARVSLAGADEALNRTRPAVGGSHAANEPPAGSPTIAGTALQHATTQRRPASASSCAGWPTPD